MGDDEGAGLDEVENADCERLRGFLEWLARNEENALLAFINNPPEFLARKQKEGILQAGDVQLLLSNDYRRVLDLMSRCNSAVRWVVVWIV
jgi:hypothetical protein